MSVFQLLRKKYAFTILLTLVLVCDCFNNWYTINGYFICCCISVFHLFSAVLHMNGLFSFNIYFLQFICLASGSVRYFILACFLRVTFIVCFQCVHVCCILQSFVLADFACSECQFCFLFFYVNGCECCLYVEGFIFRFVLYECIAVSNLLFNLPGFRIPSFVLYTIINK